MLSTYRRVLSLPGALVFSMSGLVARLPMSMISLGIVLLVTSSTGSYAQAGAVSASFLIASAALSVPQARLIDRLGQRTVLAPAVTVFVIGVVGLMTAVQTGHVTPWAHLSAAVAGAAFPQVDSCVRARWSYLVSDKRDLLTAFAFESVVDEVVFIVGPTLVTVLVTVVHPLAGLVTASAAAAVGTAVFVSQRRTEPPPAGRAAERRAGSMHWEMLGPLVLCGFAMGILLGGAEVATVAFSQEQGDKPLAGVMLAIWALGSLLAGVVTGALRIHMSNARRFRWGLLALATLMVPLPFVDGFALLALFLFLAGFAISPTLIASFAWIEELVPAGRLTEGMTIFITGLSAGLAPGAAVVGRVVDASGASASFWVTVVAGFGGAALAFAVAGLSAARPSPSGSSG
jgi:MFS family permease